MTVQPRPSHRRSATDLVWVAAAPVAVFVLASWFELFERYVRLTVRFERYEIDELLFALAALALALAWYALRRLAEARRSLALHLAAESHVTALLARNRELSHQLIAVQERERLALARELHDDLGQSCAAIRVEAALAGQAASAGDMTAAAAAAARIGAAADTLHDRVGHMLRVLRPADLDALGLVGALQALCESWEASSGVACVFHADGAFDRLGEAADVSLYRIAQEALSNVMRHAGASTVRIALRRDGGEVRLTVHDDGVGFDPQLGTRGLGLLGATERAAVLGGSVEISSAPGAGTTLGAAFPTP
jgi:two-component system sensor histidine kinase UhpB